MKDDRNVNAQRVLQKYHASRYLLKVMSTLIACMLFIGLSGITSAFAANDNQFAGQQNPASVVAASYQAMDAAMNTGNVIRNPGAAQTNLQVLLPMSQAHVSSSAQGAYLYKYDLYRVSVFRNWAALHTHDFSATKVWSTFQVTSTTINGSQAIVTGVETLHIDATIQDNGQSHHFSAAKQAAQAWIQKTGRFIAFGQTNDEKGFIKHTVTLSQSGKDWAIENDTYWDPLAKALTPDHQSLAGHTQPTGNYAGKKQGFSPNSYTYNRSSAISYADYWAQHGCNPNYQCYESQDTDCANFVSQALYDGNGGNLPGDNTWYAGSLAFVNAQSLHDYMAGTFAAATYSSYDYNTAAYDDSMYDYPGDLVFYDWGNVFGFGNADGVIDHVAISASQDGNGYTYEDAHTTDLYHAYWDLGGGSQSGYYFIVMKNNG